MSCTNCYTGCVEITPDKCVRYTGENSVPLGIETGDTLLAVEQTLIQNVVSFLDGTGIDITIAPADYCALVTAYLPVGVTPNSVQLFTALVKAACNLQTQITGIFWSYPVNLVVNSFSFHKSFIPFSVNT